MTGPGTHREPLPFQPMHMEVGMESLEKYRQELQSASDDTLKTLIDMRFVWQDSVTREERDEFYARQGVAEEVLAERRGTPLPPRDTTVSVWTRSRLSVGDQK